METDEKKETIKDIKATSTLNAISNDSFGIEAFVNKIKQRLEGGKPIGKEGVEDIKFIIVFILVLLNGLFIFMLITFL